MTTLQTSEQHIASLIDHTLANFFKESLEQARSVDSHYALLWENLARLHASGGKRIRPKIVVMSYLAFGGQDLEAIIPIACAQELLHFSMLIHDDIIDRDLIRYGVDNITGSYQYIYEPLVPNKADRLHYANSAAILAGDLMIAGAHRLITQSTFSADKRLLALSRMYESIFSSCRWRTHRHRIVVLSNWRYRPIDSHTSQDCELFVRWPMRCRQHACRCAPRKNSVTSRFRDTFGYRVSANR